MSESKENVPKIRFPGFNDAWEKRKLSDVSRYRNGKAHENDISEKGKYVVVNSKFVSTDGQVRKYSDDQIEPLYKNDIAFVLSDVPNGRAIAKTFLVEKDDKYTLNQRIAGISPFDDMYPYFLHIMMNRNGYFLKFDDGVKQTNLSVADVMSFESFYPQFEEQQKIGQFFQSLDHLITLHKRKLNDVKNLKAGLLQKMFPKDGEDFPEVRFPGFTSAWELRRLSELAEFSKGQGYSKGDLKENGTPIILYGRLYTNYETVISEVDTFADVKENSVFSKGNEVIVPASGESAEDISRASVVENAGVILGGDLNILRPKPEINPAFLAITISNGTQQKELSKRAQGKSVVHIHNSDLQEVMLVYPKLKEQKKICALFRDFDHLISLHQRKLEHLQKQKKSLLQQMFV